MIDYICNRQTGQYLSLWNDSLSTCADSAVIYAVCRLLFPAIYCPLGNWVRLSVEMGPGDCPRNYMYVIRLASSWYIAGLTRKVRSQYHWSGSATWNKSEYSMTHCMTHCMTYCMTHCMTYCMTYCMTHCIIIQFMCTIISVHNCVSKCWNQHKKMICW